MTKTNDILFHKFRLPVFKAVVWVIIGKTLEKAIDYAEDMISKVLVKPETKKYLRAYTYAYETEDHKRRYILCFKFTASPGEIAHEVKHLINILFNWHGYKLSTTNDEMECYYLEEIVDKVYKLILKFRKQ